jgi:hypothetical protein
MAFLFIVENKIAVPNPETLLIEPFKSIWERDNSKNKWEAVEDFTYIEFMSSMKKSNPYRQYPENRKHDVVKEQVISRENWIVDDLIKLAIDKIKEFQTEASSTYSYYMAAKKAAENLKDFFSTVDINRDVNPKTGMPIYKPKDITGALNDTEKVLANLKNLEKKVEEELYEQEKIRSDKKISPFAE